MKKPKQQKPLRGELVKIRTGEVVTYLEKKGKSSFLCITDEGYLGARSLDMIPREGED